MSASMVPAVVAMVAVSTVVATRMVRWCRSRRGSGGGSSLSYGGEGAQRGRKRKHELFHRDINRVVKLYLNLFSSNENGMRFCRQLLTRNYFLGG